MMSNPKLFRASYSSFATSCFMIESRWLLKNLRCDRSDRSQSWWRVATVPLSSASFVAVDTPSGRGHCPFHDDAYRSFSINRAGRYFNCFAGCGGGDVIVFWEKYRQISREQAILELRSQISSIWDNLSFLYCTALA